MLLLFPDSLWRNNKAVRNHRSAIDLTEGCTVPPSASVTA